MTIHILESTQRLIERKISTHQFALIITAVFCAVAGLGMYTHELWRDEFEIFMELRDAPSFLSLFPDVQALPNLYLSLLYPLIKLWPYPATFQIFHLLVIIAAVFMFNRYSPFSYLQKILFTFSYFVLFEYGIISRDYSMLLLLVFSAVYLICRKQQNTILIALFLILLANHHLYGLFFAFSLFVYESLRMAESEQKFTPEEKKRLLIAGALLAAGALYIIPQYLSLMKFNRFAVLYGQAPWFMTIRCIWNAYFPIPETTGMHFWNTNIFPFPQLYGKNAATAHLITASNVMGVATSVFILFLSFVAFSRKLPVLITFVINTAAHLFFLQYLSVFFVRYQGPLFIIFIYCYWLFLASNENLHSLWPDRVAGIFQGRFFVTLRKLASPFITLILLIQFCVGIFCYIQDVRHPFSASYEAAKYINAENLNNNIMVGYVDYAAQAISGHLNQRIYFPQSGSFETHIKWLDPNRRDDIPLEDLFDSVILLHNKYRANVLLVLTIPLPDWWITAINEVRVYGRIRVKYLNKFTETLVEDERFFLYLVYSDT